MPVLNVYDIEKTKIAELELSDLVFGADVNEHILYEVVKMQLASRRAGGASTKGRSEVRGGGKKPWRQKGTGRARSGTSRSPVWRGGGIVFGPKPRDFSYKIPKKVRKAALKSALSMKVKEDRVIILRDFPMDEIKTKKFKEVLDRFELGKTLFVLDEKNTILEKSSKNIKDVKMLRSEGINVYDLLKYDDLVLLEPSVKKIEGVLLS
ncbi:MAG TPA: 50S ribosomal protein L4 [Syntrophales bacterium]|nr:50S ribosomal protein L4 [Syntrophales bacterium]HPQ43719.1 50S ribosomal protein L4 [Syntrophales bacterium]